MICIKESKKFYLIIRKFSNRQFINNLLLWNFGLNGILKAENVKHHKIGEKETPFNYKIEVK